MHAYWTGCFEELMILGFVSFVGFIMNAVVSTLIFFRGTNYLSEISGFSKFEFGCNPTLIIAYAYSLGISMKYYNVDFNTMDANGDMIPWHGMIGTLIIGVYLAIFLYVTDSLFICFIYGMSSGIGRRLSVTIST